MKKARLIFAIVLIIFTILSFTLNIKDPYFPIKILSIFGCIIIDGIILSIYIGKIMKQV